MVLLSLAGWNTVGVGRLTTRALQVYLTYLQWRGKRQSAMAPRSLHSTQRHEPAAITQASWNRHKHGPVLAVWQTQTYGVGICNMASATRRRCTKGSIFEPYQCRFKYTAAHEPCCECEQMSECAVKSVAVCSQGAGKCAGQTKGCLFKMEQKEMKKTVGMVKHKIGKKRKFAHTQTKQSWRQDVEAENSCLRKQCVTIQNSDRSRSTIIDKALNW